jgi:hypothetical protein
MKWRLCIFVITSRQILLRMRNVSSKSCRGNQNTNFLFNNFLPENCAVWDYVERQCTAVHASYDSKEYALFVLDKATHKHPEYVILITVSRQQCLKQRALMLRSYVQYMVCLVNLGIGWNWAIRLSTLPLHSWRNSRQYLPTSLLVQKHSNFMRDDAVTTVNHLPIRTVSYPRQLESSSAPPSQFLRYLLRSYNSQWQTDNEVCIATACVLLAILTEWQSHTVQSVLLRSTSGS